MRIVELTPAALTSPVIPVNWDSYAERKSSIEEAENDKTVITLERESTAKRTIEHTYTLFTPGDGEKTVWGLIEKNELRGVMEICLKEDRSLSIMLLCVFQGFRRRGYGTLLFSKAREMTRKTAPGLLVMRTGCANSGAQAFCRANGMELCGCAPAGFAPAADGDLSGILFWKAERR